MKQIIAIPIVLCSTVVLLCLNSKNVELPAEPVARQEPRPPKTGGKVVPCRFAANKIKLDGVLNEVAWDDAEVLKFSVPWEKRAAKTATKAGLLWNNEYLFFFAEMEDSDLYADILEPNGRIWENDVFELFFKPDDKKLAYYEFQVNAANTPLELFFPSRGAGGYSRFAPNQEIHLESFVKLNGTLNDWTDKDKGWVVEGKIPWTAFARTGGRPKVGDRWKFALCRYDYSKDLDRPETSTCAPLTQADFHRYEDYLELVFEERK
jgi:hypothetical protein